MLLQLFMVRSMVRAACNGSHILWVTRPSQPSTWQRRLIQVVKMKDTFTIYKMANKTQWLGHRSHQTKLYSFRFNCKIVSFTAANTNRMFSVSVIKTKDVCEKLASSNLYMKHITHIHTVEHLKHINDNKSECLLHKEYYLIYSSLLLSFYSSLLLSYYVTILFMQLI